MKRGWQLCVVATLALTACGDDNPTKTPDAAVTPDAGQTQTATEQRMLTPDYASPEQVRGLQITTAADIYSLGVVLYELLTNRRPHEFKTASPAEIERLELVLRWLEQPLQDG